MVLISSDVVLTLTFFVAGRETQTRPNSTVNDNNAAVVVLRLGATSLRLRNDADGVNIPFVDLFLTFVTGSGRAQSHFGHFAGTFTRRHHVDRNGLTRRRFRRSSNLSTNIQK